MDDPPAPDAPEPLPEPSPAPDPALLRAQAVRQGLARGLCGLVLCVGFYVVADQVIAGGSGVRLLVASFGACLGLGLFAQALLEHALRERGPLLRWVGCWSFAALIVLLSFAQAFAFPRLWAGDPHLGLSDAWRVVRMLLIEEPDEGLALLLSLGSPLALRSLFALHGWRWAASASATLAATVGALPLYVTLRREAKEFHMLLLVAAVGLPVLRWAGDRLEAWWTRWRGFED